MSVDLTAEERTEYDKEYQLYRDYVDSHEFGLWKERGYQEFLKRTSYDPEGRRALIAKQRAERIARTAEKKLDTLDNLLKRQKERIKDLAADEDAAMTEETRDALLEFAVALDSEKVRYKYYGTSGTEKTLIMSVVAVYR